MSSPWSWSRLGLLIDLSGTLHIEDAALPGALDAVRRLRGRPNVAVRFCTNTTKVGASSDWNGHAQSSTGVRARSAGPPGPLWPGRGPRRRLLVPHGCAALVGSEAHPPASSARGERQRRLEGLDTSDPNAVVIGLCPSDFHYEALNKAFNLVLDGASLIGIHKARYYRRSDGLALGPGAFVAALEYSAGVKAEVVGKPEAAFFSAAVDGLGAGASPLGLGECVMIGDDVMDDVVGAQAAGMMGILVRTGKYRAGDELRPEKGKRPWQVVDDISKAVDFILGHEMNRSVM